jgi:membrane protease YdiL (CAAX protease family)
MDFLSFLLMQLMAAYTVLVEPILRTNFYRMLKKQLNTDPSARVLFYRTQVLWEWSWVIVLAVILIPISQPLAWLGITVPNLIGWIIIAALLLGIGLSTLLLKRNPGAMSAMRRSLETTAVLLPSTQVERKWYAIAAVTAGICEELLYRGFLLRYLPTTFPSFDFLAAAIVSGVVYGLSRAYLGWKGIFQTTLTGFSYAIVYFLSGNLLRVMNGQESALFGCVIPAIVFHVLSELRNLLFWQPETKKKVK